jgi:RimJ/RimL family protein N-acetyltransferase
VWRFPLRRDFSRDDTQAFPGRQIADFEQRGSGLWAVEHSSGLIGYTGFDLPTFLPELMPIPEIGWRIHPSQWGQGLATEAALAALHHGSTVLGFTEVVSIYEPDNVASGRVMERLRMTHDRDTTQPDTGTPLRVYRLHRASGAAAQPPPP